MRSLPFRRKFGLPVWLLVLLALAPAQARVMQAEIAVLDAGVARAERLHLRLDRPEAASQGELVLTVARLDADDYGYRFRDLEWRCPLRRAVDGAWTCKGAVRTGRGKARELTVEVASARLGAALREGKARLALERQAAAPELTQIALQQIPVAWFEAFLATLWPEGRPQSGRIDGELQLRTSAQDGTALGGRLRLSGLNLDTPDGWLATADLGSELRLDYRQSAARRDFELRGDLRGGELLAGSVYVALPKSAVAVTLRGEQAGRGGWRFPAIGWNDGGVLKAQGSAAFDPEFALTALDLDARVDDLATARDRYLSGWLGLAGLSDLRLSGAAGAHLRLDESGPRTLRLQLDEVNAVDPGARFTFAGLSGAPHWSADAAPERSELRWRSGALYGIGLGAGRFSLESAGGELRLAAPVTLAVLGGQLQLEQFALTPALAGKGTRARLGLNLQNLDLALLSQRLGWPPFTGRLDGRLPAARYADDRLVLEGDVTMHLFDGTVRLSHLAMERPFGVAPTLAADIGIDDLDLPALTGVFGFGEITGRLDGNIDGLRLVDWSPVAFDARFRTDPAYKGKKRISQRAVRDLSSVGGSGFVGGLQAQVLKVFDDFGYRRIGLSCVLRDNVCAMDGTGSAGQGYTIVEGAGLPRITVVGFQRQVDWPVLLDRLKAATAGQTPIIQ